MWADRRHSLIRGAGLPATWLRSLVGEDGMRQNALFQLATGLGTPGTARKEDVAIAKAPVAAAAVATSEERADHFVVRNGVRCAGAHLIVDLYGAERLDDVDHIEEALRRCVDAAGATLLHIHLHHFEPNGGVSGVAVLAESHISIHSWPEANYAAVDIFMCGKANPDACIPVLRETFKAKNVAVSELLRGRVT
jgi:S-adenosylmethionine decarboxylase